MPIPPTNAPPAPWARSLRSVKEQTLRWPGGWARIGPWRGSQDIGYLSIGAERPPTSAFVDRCLDALSRDGYSSVVTSALAPAETLPFADRDFGVRERLHLLEHGLSGLERPMLPSRRARRSDRAPLLEIDARAFDEFWHIDQLGLEHALRATPSSRFRVCERRPSDAARGEGRSALVGYAITGRSGLQGYLQRLAVAPEAHRQGWGASLVADGLRWLARHGVVRTLVNTQIKNEAALELYKRSGFSLLPVNLVVMDRTL